MFVLSSPHAIEDYGRQKRFDDVTEGLMSYFKSVLDKSGQNTQTIIEFVQALKVEVNLSDNHKRNCIVVLGKLSQFHNNKSFRQMTRDDIISFLDSGRKTEVSDPLHKWIGTYNLRRMTINRFYRWLYSPELETAKRPNPPMIDNLPFLKRKEKSIYKPSDLWTAEDDLLFLKYCPYKRDKCYHAISRDTSCRPHEILKLRIKDVTFKMAGERQYAEVLVNGKTGTRQIPLINSIPYLKDWLDDHPAKGNLNAPLICGYNKTLGRRFNIHALWKMYDRNKSMFRKLLDDPSMLPEDKMKIRELLKKPWNAYIRRHSALTDKSKILKEHVLRQHAGWSVGSNMPQVYLHYFGNESSESLLEAYGLKPKTEELDKMKPTQCPNCNEANKPDSKFCASCRMVLSYDAYTETVEEKSKKEDELIEIKGQVQEIFKMLKETRDPDKHTEFAENLFKSGLIRSREKN